MPGIGDNPFIDIAGTNTVIYSSSTSTIQSLVSNENFTVSGSALTVNGNLNLTGGTLVVNGTLTVTGTFTLNGGTLRNASIASGTILSTSSGTLDAVTISLGGEVITSASTGTTVINGLTVNGKITLGNGSGSN